VYKCRRKTKGRVKIKVDKVLIYEQLLEKSTVIYQGAIDAAERAYKTATDNGNIAENKYDTLALEASYLEQGQTKRLIECAQELAAFKRLQISLANVDDFVCQGSLVELMDDEDNFKYVFLAPCSGGLKLQYSEIEIIVVTPKSPLGSAINQKSTGSEIQLFIGHSKKTYEIVQIY